MIFFFAILNFYEIFLKKMLEIGLKNRIGDFTVQKLKLGRLT